MQAPTPISHPPTPHRQRGLIAVGILIVMTVLAALALLNKSDEVLRLQNAKNPLLGVFPYNTLDKRGTCKSLLHLASTLPGF